MLLALDVGNTNICAGAYDGEQRLDTWRFATNPDTLAESMRPLLSGYAITEVAIASVVPASEEALRLFCEQRLSVIPYFVRSGADYGIRLRYNPPESLGADRLCNVAGCLAKHGAPAIVIDFGTATKLEAIDANGDYLGGAIMPGIRISIEALTSRAARLFAVEWKIPERAIGTSSAEALQSGFAFGFAGQAEGMIQRFRDAMGCRAQVIATGGLAAQIVPACPSIETLDPFLTLDGVRALYARRRA